MLPVPYDRPQVAILQYSQHQPPTIPNIAVHPEGQQLLMAATSACANALSNAAQTSVIRMFCYNLMSSHGWNNQDFYDMVRVTVDHVTYRKLTNQMGGNIFVTLEEVANSLSMLYSAKLAAQYQEFYCQLPPASQQGIQHNLPLLNDWVAKADSIYSTYPQHQQQATHNFQRPQTVMSGALNMGSNPGPRGGHVGLNQMHNQMARGRHMQPSSNPAAAGVSVGHHQAKPVDNFIQNKFCAGARTARNTDIEGEHMNRNIHQIAYRGTTLVAPQQRQNKKPEIKNNVPPPMASMMMHEQPQVGTLPYFPGDVCEVNLETALESISSAVTQSAKVMTAEYLAFKTIILEAVHSAIQIPEALSQELKGCVTFAKVSEVLRKYSASMTDPDDAYFWDIFMMNLDKTITSKANEYFSRQMPDGGFTISSVLEDGADVQNHVSSTYKTRANPSFVSFQKSFLSNLFSVIGKDGAELPGEEKPELKPVDYVILMTQMLVTSISTTAEEYEMIVGEHLDREGGLVVTPETNAFFFDILSTLIKAGKDIGSSKNMLVTMDGVKWVFWENATDSQHITIKQE